MNNYSMALEDIALEGAIFESEMDLKVSNMHDTGYVYGNTSYGNGGGTSAFESILFGDDDSYTNTGFSAATEGIGEGIKNALKFVGGLFKKAAAAVKAFIASIPGKMKALMDKMGAKSRENRDAAIKKNVDGGTEKDGAIAKQIDELKASLAKAETPGEKSSISAQISKLELKAKANLDNTMDKDISIKSGTAKKYGSIATIYYNKAVAGVNVVAAEFPKLEVLFKSLTNAEEKADDINNTITKVKKHIDDTYTGVDTAKTDFHDAKDDFQKIASSAGTQAGRLKLFSYAQTNLKMAKVKNDGTELETKCLAFASKAEALAGQGSDEGEGVLIKARNAVITAFSALASTMAKLAACYVEASNDLLAIFVSQEGKDAVVVASDYNL